jgi:hypothetical protein
VDISKLPYLLGTKTTFAWSSILPRLNWRSVQPNNLNNSTIKDINRSAARHILSLGGRYIKNKEIRNKEITYDTPGLFLYDGVHLSDISLDILLSSFKELIEIVITGKNVPCFD